MPVLGMAANLGLLLYLFLVGLEVDLRIMLKNWRIALSVGLAGMALPFGLGCAIAYGLYHQFRGEPGVTPVAFGTYMLFVGVAMAITVRTHTTDCTRSDTDSESGIPRTLPYPDRIETVGHPGRHCHLDRWRRQ